MTEAKYIAVDGRVPSIIKHCEDRTCDRYHDWLTLESSASIYDAEQIVRAMNLMEAPKPELSIRPNPEMPSDHALNEIMVQNGGLDSRTTGLRAIWRAGCDAGMVAS